MSRNASDQDIKSAYRKLAIKYHPDKNPDNREAEEKFKEAAEAYSILSDGEKRARFDRYGYNGIQGNFSGFDPSTFSDFGDILGEFFGLGDLFGGRRRRGGPERGSDLRYDLKIAFKEAAFGVKTRIKYQRLEVCLDCNGRGAPEGKEPTKCSACGGSGQQRFQQGFFSVSRTCRHCDGVGQIISEPCESCRGRGRTHKEKTLEVRVPAGVDNGSRLRVQGEGEGGSHNGPSGDLYVVIFIEEHPFFQRQGNDIYCQISIGVTQAVLGADIDIPTLEDDEKLRIPEGTQSGTVFRLRGKGITILGERGRGDLLVTTNVVIPTKLSKEERQLYESLGKTSKNVDLVQPQSEQTIFEKVKNIFG